MRSTFVVLGLLLLGLAPGSAAGAQEQLTCLEEIDGGRLDDEPDFAGRVRSVAGPDGEIASRSLRCPYVNDDGRRTELVLDWDERSLGRHRCAAQELVVEGSDPTRARLDHPDRQAAVLLTGPDRAAVNAMEAAARLNLAAVPTAAAPCSAAPAPAAASSSGGPDLIALAAAGAAALAVGGLALLALRARRRRVDHRPAAPVAAPSRVAVGAEIERIDAAAGRTGRASGPAAGAQPLVRHLVERGRPGRLDSTAAAAALAHGRGRDDLAAVARRAWRPARGGGGRCGRSGVAARILESGATAADGVSVADARRRLEDARRVLEQRLDDDVAGPVDRRVR